MIVSTKEIPMDRFRSKSPSETAYSVEKTNFFGHKIGQKMQYKTTQKYCLLQNKGVSCDNFLKIYLHVTIKQFYIRYFFTIDFS